MRGGACADRYLEPTSVNEPRSTTATDTVRSAAVELGVDRKLIEALIRLGEVPTSQPLGRPPAGPAEADLVGARPGGDPVPAEDHRRVIAQHVRRRSCWTAESDLPPRGARRDALPGPGGPLPAGGSAHRRSHWRRRAPNRWRAVRRPLTTSCAASSGPRGSSPRHAASVAGLYPSGSVASSLWRPALVAPGAARRESPQDLVVPGDRGTPSPGPGPADGPGPGRWRPAGPPPAGPRPARGRAEAGP